MDNYIINRSAILIAPFINVHMIKHAIKKTYVCSDVVLYISLSDRDMNYYDLTTLYLVFKANQTNGLCFICGNRHESLPQMPMKFI